MDLFETILNNLSYVGSVIFLIFVFQLANMSFGIADNVGLKGEKFDVEKLKNWGIRTITTLVGITLLTLGASLIPYIVSLTSIAIPTEYGDVVTVSIIILTAYKSVLTEAKKAFEHFEAIMNR